MPETTPQKTDLEVALAALREEPSAEELAAFLNAGPPAGEQPLTAEELAADWRAVQQRRGRPPAPQAVASLPVVPFPVGRAPEAGPWHSLSTWRLLAAAALVGCVGLGLWVSELRRQLGRLGEVDPSRASVAAMKYAFLSATAETSRGEERPLGGKRKQVELGAERLGLLLDLPGSPPPGLTYEASCARVDGARTERLWTKSGLAANDKAQVGLLLPQQMPATGVYVIELRAESGGEKGPVARYELVLERLPRAPDTPTP